MKPYTLTLISKEDMSIFQKIKDAVVSLPEILPLGYNQKQKCDVELSCHILAEAVRRKFGVIRIDGKYEPNYGLHSWCRTSSGHIIDVYPCGEIVDMKIVPKFVYVQERNIPEQHRTSNQLHTIYKAESIDIENFISNYAFESAVRIIVSYWK